MESGISGLSHVSVMQATFPAFSFRMHESSSILGSKERTLLTKMLGIDITFPCFECGISAIKDDCGVPVSDTTGRLPSTEEVSMRSW